MKVRSQLHLFRDEPDPAPLRVWVDPDEPDADNFAGGGGASLGIRQAYQEIGIERRAPVIAVNHWPEALAMYSANNPGCRVFCEDILKVDPVVASGGKRIAYAHFSPTCIFFSQAAGAALDAEEAAHPRRLANVAITWAASLVRPRAMSLENVKPFMQWGPLHRQHTAGNARPGRALWAGVGTQLSQERTTRDEEPVCVITLSQQATSTSRLQGQDRYTFPHVTTYVRDFVCACE